MSNNTYALNECTKAAITKDVEAVIEKCKSKGSLKRCFLYDDSYATCEYRGKNVRTEITYDKAGMPHMKHYYDCNHPSQYKNKTNL